MDWVKERWQSILSAIAVIAGILLTLFKINSNSREQKKVLSKANESHKKEMEVMKSTEKELKEGLDELDHKKEKEISKINEEEVEKTSKLQKEKKDFVSNQKNSDDLAKNLAKEIGADFVDSSND